MGRIWFVTGTDTGVGKTYVTAALVAGLRALGRRAIGLKPVETGCARVDGLWVGEDGQRLARASGRTEVDLPLYRFEPPVGPTVAARQVGQEVMLERITIWIRTHAATHDHVIVEGVGGLMVPLRGRQTVLTLLEQLQPEGVVLVGRNRLGALSQVLLAQTVLKSHRLPLLGVVLSPGDGHHALAEQTNHTELEGFVKPVLRMPTLNLDDASACAAVGRSLLDALEPQVWTPAASGAKSRLRPSGGGPLA